METILLNRFNRTPSFTREFDNIGQRLRRQADASTKERTNKNADQAVGSHRCEKDEISQKSQRTPLLPTVDFI